MKILIFSLVMFCCSLALAKGKPEKILVWTAHMETVGVRSVLDAVKQVHPEAEISTYIYNDPSVFVQKLKSQEVLIIPRYENYYGQAFRNLIVSSYVHIANELLDFVQKGGKILAVDDMLNTLAAAGLIGTVYSGYYHERDFDILLPDHPLAKGFDGPITDKYPACFLVKDQTQGIASVIGPKEYDCHIVMARRIGNGVVVQTGFGHFEKDHALKVLRNFLEM
jgi:hypothetical protein